MCDNAGAVNLQLGLVVLKVQVDNNDVVFALSVDIGKRCGPPKCVQKIKKIKKKSKARNKERKERHIRCAKKKKNLNKMEEKEGECRRCPQGVEKKVVAAKGQQTNAR